nr:acyl carrier protein [Kwoniella shandongensis]KAA5531448.1 acyl carrier protein [Kwoniella shandongensis]
MYRSLPVLRSALPSTLRTTTPLLLARPSQSITKIVAAPISRSYAASAGLSKDDISSRVLDVLKSFEKVDGGKLSPSASFTSDLGLDSLDAVEVVMAIEEEFAIEIPDAEADEITTVQKAIDYVANSPEAH